MTDEPESEIVVDSREPWEDFFAYFDEMDAPPSRLEALKNKTDFIVRNEDELAIQRKEINDFKASIGDLKDDLFELRTHHDHTALLIEGRWKISNNCLVVRRGNAWKEIMPAEHLHKFILSQQLRGTMFFYTANKRETAGFLIDAYEYMDGGIQTESNPQSPVTLLTLFPGVGPSTAARIVEQFGDVGSAIGNISKWDTVKGVGPKTMSGIEEWLYGDG